MSSLVAQGRLVLEVLRLREGEDLNRLKFSSDDHWPSKPPTSATCVLEPSPAKVSVTSNQSGARVPGNTGIELQAWPSVLCHRGGLPLVVALCMRSRPRLHQNRKLQAGCLHVCSDQLPASMALICCGSAGRLILPLQIRVTPRMMQPLVSCFGQLALKFAHVTGLARHARGVDRVNGERSLTFRIEA